VRAAFAWADAAWRVSFLATVRERRAVDLLGAFAAVLREVERVRADVVLRAGLFRAVLRRAAGLGVGPPPLSEVVFVVVVGVFVVSAIAGISPLVGPGKDISSKSVRGRWYPANTCL
jgi:hypothetical protein